MPYIKQMCTLLGMHVACQCCGRSGLTCIPQKGAPVVHVLLIIPVDSVVVVQVVLDPGQVDGVIGAVARKFGDGESVALMLIAVVAVHAALAVCWRRGRGRLLGGSRGWRFGRGGCGCLCQGGCWGLSRTGCGCLGGGGCGGRGWGRRCSGAGRRGRRGWVGAVIVVAGLLAGIVATAADRDLGLQLS